MKKGRISSILLIVFSMSLLSCGSNGGRKKGGGTKSFTSATGWKPNDQKGWFFSGKKKPKIKAWPGMVFIEGGSFTMGLVKDDVMHDWNNTPRRMQVHDFFMGETEITNYEYREYLTWLKVVLPPEESDMNKNIYEGSLPDDGVFANKLAKNDFSNDTYLFASEYSYYPVVGVSWLQAKNYCDWLTERAREKDLMNKGILSKDYYQNEEYNYNSAHFDSESYLNNDTNIQDAIDSTRIAKQYNIRSENERILRANRGTQGFDIAPFRLPTEVEWEYAALALPDDREYNLYQGKSVAQNELRGEKGRDRGQYMANFKVGRGDYSGIGGYGNDGSAITSDVKQYRSNEFGIYGMYGNVAEWTADVYRPVIDDEASDFNYFRGQTFSEPIDNGSGGFVKFEDDVEFDTLNNGKLVYKRLPGQYKKEIYEDNINYRDGDQMSQLNPTFGDNTEVIGFDDDGSAVTEEADSDFLAETENSTGKMYDSPKRQFYVDEKGRVILQKDEETRTSEISDEVRVIKGGSWKDPIYWLDPGQRRYKHQAEASSWIGFRVAQDYYGTKTSKRSKTGVKN